MDSFAKQLDTVTTSKVISVADNLAGKLRHADEVIGDAAQNFRLNIGVEPQLVSGVAPTGPNHIDRLTSKLYDFVSMNKGDILAHTSDVSKSFSLNMSDDVAEGLGKTTQQASQVSDEFASGSVAGKSLDSNDITSPIVLVD